MNKQKKTKQLLKFIQVFNYKLQIMSISCSKCLFYTHYVIFSSLGGGGLLEKCQKY